MIASLIDTVGPNALGGIIAALFILVVGWFFRWMRKHVAEPLQAVPGIVERQESMETKLNAAVSDIGAIKTEVHANHGSSLRDSVNRNEIVTRVIAEHVGVDPDTVVPPMPESEP
jgi:hypothetical protein